VIHTLPGRLRVRLGGPRLEGAEAVRLAEAVARLPGVTEVKVDPRSGSILCVGTDELRPEHVVETVTAVAGVAEVQSEAAPANPGVSGVAREIGRLFHDLNRGVLRGTDGHLDLTTLATCSFIGAGALEVAVKRKLPAPPWFNLAWWGFRTFMTLEKDAIREGAPAPAPLALAQSPGKE
jgi:copper chaperone CopZ